MLFGAVLILLVGVSWLIALLAGLHCIGPCAPNENETNVGAVVLAGVFTVGVLVAKASVVRRIWRSA